TGSSYTATGAGSYKVVVTDSNGCTGESSATITEVECVTKIIVDKVTDPSGSAESFEFTGSWSGGTPFSLKDSDTPYDSGNLAPGTYTVTENVPEGWDLSSITIEGDNDGGSSTSGSTATIDLDAGETIRVTFKNTLKTGGLGKLDVSGYKFNDLNGNGQWDTGEPGIEGWTIYLSDGTTTISTTTDSDGKYTFTNLPAGTYKITEETKAGWTRTTQESYTIEFDGEEDKSVADQNFGNVQAVQPEAKLVITSTPQDPCSNTPVVVTVSCENLQGDLCGSIASMTLYYDSSSVEMTKGLNGKWTATVPGQSAGTTLSAHAVPKDSQGNFIESIGTTATVEIRWINCAIDIEKTADRQTVEPGGTITYTLTVKNTGSATINDATVVDTLPPGTLYKSADPLPSGVSGSVVTWNLGELEGGASVVIKLTATVESDVCTRQSFTPSDEQNQKRGPATSPTQP
ncbi:SdrD B-like domain-containing protein, partial [Methanothrix sp.]